MSDIPPIHLCIVQPSGYVHSLGFLDQARHFRFQFRRHGATVTMSKNRLHYGAINFVFGAHLGFDAEMRKRYCCVFVNLEQIGQGGALVSADYLKLLSNSAVVDYNADNVAGYASEVGSVPLVPFLYSPYLTPTAPIPLEDRPIDLLFFGSMNAHRQAWIERIEALGHNVSVFDSALYGAERDHYIVQAKAVLNVHFYESSRFEQARVSHCLSLGTPVISERTARTDPHDAFEDSVLWITSDAEFEQFFSQDFKTPAYFEAMRGALNRFRDTDAVEAYADLLAFAVGFHRMQHAGMSGAPWRPKRINLGSGQTYRAGWLNLDVAEHKHPDLLLDLSAPLILPLSMVSATAGPVRLEEGSVHHIEANNVLEHVPQLTTLMGNCLRLLAVGGELRIEVPIEGSPTAWQDPRHVRAFNSSSWGFFTDRFWHLGWFEHRFEMGESTYLDSSVQPCTHEQAAFMRLSFRKVETTARERTVARTLQSELRVPEDCVLPHEMYASAGAPETSKALSPTRLERENFLMLDTVDQAVGERLEQGDADGAMALIVHGVNNHYILPEFFAYALYCPQLDRRLEQLAAKLDTEEAAPQASSRGSCSLLIATELYALGGHTRVLEDVSHEVPNPVILLTDLFYSYRDNAAAAAALETRFAHATVIVMPPVSYWEKCKMLRRIALEMNPAHILFFSHQQDPIPYVSTLALTAPAKLLFHHADHTASLGCTLGSIKHIDFTDRLGDVCASQLGIGPTILPMYVADAGCKAFAPLASRLFSVVTSGRLGKFQRYGAHSLQEIVATVLAAVSGSFMYIGPLPADWVAEIQSHLATIGLNPLRFEHRGAVDSLWLELLGLDAYCYLGSAPQGGGRAAIEAQGCGYPLVFFKPEDDNSLLANYSLYASQELGWSTQQELVACLQKVYAEHSRYSEASRRLYDAKYSRQHFNKTLSALLTN
jgi:hypothetical protein